MSLLLDHRDEKFTKILWKIAQKKHPNPEKSLPTRRIDEKMGTLGELGPHNLEDQQKITKRCFEIKNYAKKLPGTPPTKRKLPEQNLPPRQIMFRKIRSKLTKPKVWKEFSKLEGQFRLIEVEDFGQQLLSRRRRLKPKMKRKYPEVISLPTPAPVQTPYPMPTPTQLPPQNQT